MRLWSIHPKHLDSRGLVVLWREALLAREVLRGKKLRRRSPSLWRKWGAGPLPYAISGFAADRSRHGSAAAGRSVSGSARIR